MKMSAQAGRRGKDIRSDCWVEITPKEDSGISIELQSKVDVLYGESIRELIQNVLSFFEISNASITIEDSGALPCACVARIETAIKRLFGDETREYLLPEIPQAVYQSTRERFRRTRLYLPGNDPKLAINAGIHKPDGIILDLEDSVLPEEKDAARILVRNTLRGVDFYGAERMVRINQLPLGFLDLRAVVPQRPNVILIPKCESAQQVRDVERTIASILKEKQIEWEIFLMPIIESALGALHAYEIATASGYVVALAVGLEDYTADIGAERTLEGKESFFMRSMVVNAARAAGVQPIDTVFSDVNDMEGLRASTLEARSLGFDGKGCIHPRQIAVIHDAFAPPPKEIEKAKRIVLAFEDAEKRGLGVVALGSKMIDPPVVKRALRTVDIAIKSGLITERWREEAVNE